MNLLDNVIMVMFLSFVVGIVVDPALRRMTNYEWLSTRYLFRNSRTYEALGILWFRRLLEVTPLGSFNRDLKFSKDRDLKTFLRIRSHMASAEMSHWIGFVTMLALTFVAWWHRGTLVGIGYVFFNLFGNVYPSMLQQYNKRRLCRLIELAERSERRQRPSRDRVPPAR